MTYNDIIEYIDDTFDENFEEAKHWCRDNGASLVELIERRIEKDGVLYRYFQIVKNPEPTPADKGAQVRAIRDAYINGIEWRVSRYRDQKELGRETDDDEETYLSVLEYMQYLRDIPEQPDFPNIEVLTFDEWRAD